MSLHSNLPKRVLLAVALTATFAASAADNGKTLAMNQAMSQARGQIANHLNAVQGVSEDSFEARDAVVDADGTEHVRFERKFRGLRMIGGDVVTQSRRGQLRSALLTLRSKQRPSLTPRIGKDEAVVEAGARFGDRVEQVRGSDLVVYARGAKPVLAYEVTLQGEAGDNHSGLMSYYIDAASGKVLDVQDLIQTAAATGVGKSLYYGDLSISTDKKSETKYDLIDTTRGGGSVYDAKGGVVSGFLDIFSTTGSATLMSDTDNVWGDHTTGDRATVAADIHYGVGVTWDYFKNVHGRSGLAGDGKGVKSYAHTNFKTKSGAITGANAAYVALVKSMFYGDGDAARGYSPVVGLDVAGHEMAHGVTAATAKLAYSGDAGGLNEATSDIFGTLVEFYANNANDPADYRIGEKMRSDGGAFREMYNQAADTHSFNCYIPGGFDTSLSDGIHNPHYTSGVGNRFFYLAAEGAVAPAGTGLTPAQLVCNGDTGVTGIGRDKVGKIWYRALTTKFTSSTTYPQARAATLAAAAELYGAGSAEQAAVARAWSAAKVD
ncbi:MULTISPECIES: M4 family metallopeptidase [Lysobacter]|uniref:M4 family metallopeptidase n=1 Tax=Lysobacter TaxID=68 RepID=UPI001F30E6D9|nr:MULTISPECIES: M4 family metallopeptidase [Lysobacter]UJB19102.1 M4 family metallopeptidase [Lysobacter capsici]UJQ27173.1 M4 family metallopeptidase [Lysobacter gummosus]